MTHDNGALAGLKVLELAQLIAGPLSGSLLADLGADVVHVEDPVHGDPQRKTGVLKDGRIPLWWKMTGRNKRCITLDLRRPEGQDLARRLARWADVVITNFRAETLERWGLDWPALHRENESLIVLQITGFGVRSSRRNEPGFGKVGEAMSGVVHLTGFPEGPPVHTGFSHADSVTGLMGAFAVQAALYRRDHDPDFKGEWIDLALFESLYRLIEWQVITYDQTGQVPQRAGNQLAIGPAAVINTYMSRDGKWVTVTSGTPRSVQNVAALLGEPAEHYTTPAQQHAERNRLDALLREWVAARDAGEALSAMVEAEVTGSLIYSVEDILADPVFAERDEVVTVPDDDLGPVRMQAVIPKLANHGGRVWRTGPPLGADNERVYREYLGLSADELRGLEAEGVV